MAEKRYVTINDYDDLGRIMCTYEAKINEDWLINYFGVDNETQLEALLMAETYDGVTLCADAIKDSLYSEVEITTPEFDPQNNLTAYKVRIEEKYVKEVEVFAQNRKDAEKITQGLYNEGIIYMDDDAPVESKVTTTETVVIPNYISAFSVYGPVSNLSLTSKIAAASREYKAREENKAKLPGEFLRLHIKEGQNPFIKMKNTFLKTDGDLMNFNCVHGTISFSSFDRNPAEFEKHINLGTRNILNKYFKNMEAVAVIHNNYDDLLLSQHIHYFVNPIDITTGQRMDISNDIFDNISKIAEIEFNSKGFRGVTAKCLTANINHLTHKISKEKDELNR